MTLSPPLLARIRRRLRTMVWLLALVVLAKGALASLCIGDGVMSGDPRAETALVTASADAPAVHADDGDGAPCWHAGSGGCHCTCVHAAALPLVASTWGAAPESSARIPLPPASARHILLPPALRPPIA